VRGPERRHRQRQRQRRQGLRAVHRRPLGQPAVVVLCRVGDEHEVASFAKVSQGRLTLRSMSDAQWTRVSGGGAPAHLAQARLGLAPDGLGLPTRLLTTLPLLLLPLHLLRARTRGQRSLSDATAASEMRASSRNTACAGHVILQGTQHHTKRTSKGEGGFRPEAWARPHRQCRWRGARSRPPRSAHGCRR